MKIFIFQYIEIILTDNKQNVLIAMKLIGAFLECQKLFFYIEIKRKKIEILVPTNNSSAIVTQMIIFIFNIFQAASVSLYNRTSGIGFTYSTQNPKIRR